MAVTVMTHVALRDAPAAEEWDSAMDERLNAARGQAGWIGGQLLRAANDPLLRTIVGTWQTREHWEAWHNEEAFRETRERLEGLQSRPAETSWHEVIQEHRGA
jgi:heme-degrading monooxygenase HmoA